MDDEIVGLGGDSGFGNVCARIQIARKQNLQEHSDLIYGEAEEDVSR